MHVLLAVVSLGPTVLGVGQDVVDVYDLAVENRPPRRRCPILSDRILLDDLLPLGVPVTDRGVVEVAVLPRAKET